MFRRPKADDTEDDLLQMQLELQASSEFIPSAKVIRVGNSDAKNTSSVGLTDGNQFNLHARVTTVEEGVIERHFDTAMKIEPPRRAAQSGSFPAAFRRTETAAETEKVGDKKKRSIFAQQLAAKRANLDNSTTSADSNATKAAAHDAAPTNQATVSREVAAEASEKPAEFSSESVLRRIPQRIVAAKEIDKIHRENADYLASFSEAELLEEQKRLLSTLGQSTISFLRALRENSARESAVAADQSKPAASPAVKSDPLSTLHGEQHDTDEAPFTAPPTTVHGACCELHNKAEPDLDAGIELAVDESGQPTIVDRRSDRAPEDVESYSLDAISQLARSAIAQQRSFAFTLLRKAWSMSVAQQNEKALNSFYSADFATLARRALDDSTAQCVADGTNLAHALTLCSARLTADRVARQIVLPVGAVRFHETYAGDKEDDGSSVDHEEDGRLSDADLAKRDVLHAFVTRMRAASRLAYLASDARLHVATAAATRERVFELACASAAHCPRCADRIYESRLFDTLLREFDFGRLQSADSRVYLAATLIGDLFTALGAASRRTCEKLVRRHSLLEAMFLPLLSALNAARPSTERVLAQRSASDAISLIIAYRIEKPNFFWLVEALRDVTDADSHISLVRVSEAVFASPDESRGDGSTPEAPTETAVLFELLCAQLRSLDEQCSQLNGDLSATEFGCDSQTATTRISRIAHLVSAVATFCEDKTAMKVDSLRSRFVEVFEFLVSRLFNGGVVGAVLQGLPVSLVKLLDAAPGDAHIMERCAASVSILTALLRIVLAGHALRDRLARAEIELVDSARASLVSRIDGFERLFEVVDRCAAHESHSSLPHQKHHLMLLRSIANAALMNCELFLRIADVSSQDASLNRVFDFALSLLSIAHANRTRFALHHAVIETCLRVLLRADLLRARISASDAVDGAMATLNTEAAVDCYVTFLTDAGKLADTRRFLDVRAPRIAFFVENATSSHGIEGDVNCLVVPLLSTYRDRAKRAVAVTNRKVLIESTLSMFVLLDAIDRLAVDPKSTMLYTMLVYLIGSDCYLETMVRSMISHLIVSKVPQCAQGSCKMDAKLPFNLETAYNELLSVYEAASYNDSTFANVLLLLPFALSHPNSDAYRRLLVVHHSAIFRAMRLVKTELLLPLGILLGSGHNAALETETDILEAYATSVLVEKPISSVVYAICIHRLNASCYQDVDEDASSQLGRFRTSLIRRLAQAVNAGQIETVRDLLLYERTDEDGKIVLHVTLPEQQAKRLRVLLRSAQVDTAWLADTIFDELTLKYLLEFI